MCGGRGILSIPTCFKPHNGCDVQYVERNVVKSVNGRLRESSCPLMASLECTP